MTELPHTARLDHTASPDLSERRDDQARRDANPSNALPVSTRTERGQSTVEYALILVAVTVVVGVVITYLSGNGAGAITGLFDAAFDRMRSLVGG